MKPVSLFSQHLWRRFWAIASPYWRGEQRLRAWGLLLVLVLLMPKVWILLPKRGE